MTVEVTVNKYRHLGITEEVAAERRRQMEVEGWAPAHDDTHSRGELALAASCYAQWSTFDQDHRRHATIDGWLLRETGAPRWWPMDWSAKWWKPSIGIPRRDLIKAAALIVAEIERLDRAQERASNTCLDRSVRPNMETGCDRPRA